MLEEVLRYVNNRFERSSEEGTFAISGGVLDIPALEGQYYWIEGSALNDGLHLHPAGDLEDEEFDGKVTLLAVPKALVELAAEIEQWNADNARVVDSPLASESFGGYSYTKMGASSGTETPQAAWQVQFGGRLRPYRKLARWWQ